MIDAIDKHIDRVERLINKKRAELDDLFEQKARANGWEPCDDCFMDRCSMNCSSAPAYIKVYGV